MLKRIKFRTRFFQKSVYIIIVILSFSACTFYPKIPSEPISILFGGDLMMARDISWKIDNIHEGNGNYLFEDLRDEIEDNDLIFYNLESPFGEDCPTARSTSMVFCLDEEKVDYLPKGKKFTVINLANNHITNTLYNGFELTEKILRENNFLTIGAGTNWSDVHNGEILEINNFKIGFLGYTYSPNIFAPDYEIAEIHIEDLERDVKALREKVNFVIVSFHFGNEYKNLHNKTQEQIAHSAIDFGADLIIGHHPHVVQDFEDYKGKRIYYSLGNLLFDQHWSEDTRKGILVKLKIDQESLSYEEIPVYSAKDYRVEFLDLEK